MRRKQRSEPGTLQGVPVNGRELRAMRKRLGLRQYQAAKIFGRTPSHFSRYENGVQCVPAAVITGMLAMLSNEEARAHVLMFWGIDT